MSNPMKDYVDNFRANLPSGVTFESVTARYFFNGKRFISEWDVERYREYIIKFGYSASTPFAFADLYANGEDGFIYDPSQSGLTDGDPVTGATDRINTNDATQATAANQPVYDLTAGVHSFQANGVDEWLRIPYFPIGSDYTAIISCTDPVQDQTGTSGVRPIFAPADAAGYPPGEDYHTFEFTKAGGIRMQINGDVVEDTYTPDGSPAVFTFRKEGTVGKIFRDGVEIATGTLSTTTGFATGDYALFASPVDFDTGRYAKTDLYHIMFIDRALTAQEQADAEALSATFAVPVSTDTPEITSFTISGFNVSLTASETVDIYRVYSSSATKPLPAQVKAGQDHTGASVLSYGPTELLFGETATFDDDISSLPDGVFYIHATVENASGNLSDVATVTEEKNTAIVEVTGSTNATVTNGVVIDGNTYDIYDFLDGGTLTIANDGALEARGVARGGAGGARLGGGGGAGEFGEFLDTTTGGIFVSAGTLNIVVGDSGNNGNTTFLGKTLLKGGNGGTLNSAGQDGGSGGGAGAGSNTEGVSVASDGVGNDGAEDNTNATRGGGGGGAGSSGNRGGTNEGGTGGDPISSMFTGTEEFFAAGGGGGDAASGGGTIGGDGTADGAGTDGAVNTGSGGGGGSDAVRVGGEGGSGRVTIRVRTA